MIRQRFSNRNRRTEAKQKAPELELSPLGQELRLALEESLRGQSLQLRCAMRDKTLLILGEHLLHIEPNPEQTFANLEQAVRSIIPALLPTESESLPAELPVQLLLRIAGYQQPYATHTFRCDLKPRSTAMKATSPSPQFHQVDVDAVNKAPDLTERTAEQSIATPQPTVELTPIESIPVEPIPTEATPSWEDVNAELNLSTRDVARDIPPFTDQTTISEPNQAAEAETFASSTIAETVEVDPYSTSPDVTAELQAFAAESEPEVVAASGVELAPKSVEFVTEVEDFTNETEIAPAVDLAELEAIELLDQPDSSSNFDSDPEVSEAEFSDTEARLAIEAVDPEVAASVEVITPEPAEVSTDSIDVSRALDPLEIPVAELVDYADSIERFDQLQTEEVVSESTEAFVSDLVSKNSEVEIPLIVEPDSDSIETAVEVEDFALDLIEHSTAIEIPEATSAASLDQDLETELAAVDREAIASGVEPIENSAAIEVSNLDWEANFIPTPTDSEPEPAEVSLSDLEISAAAGNASSAEADATESLTEATAASEPPHDITQPESEPEVVDLIDTQELYSTDQVAIDPVAELSEEIVAPPDFLVELIQSDAAASAPLMSSESEQVVGADVDLEILTAPETLAPIESLDDQSIDSLDETFDIANDVLNDSSFDSSDTILNTELSELAEDNWVAPEIKDTAAIENLETKVFQYNLEIPDAAIETANLQHDFLNQAEIELAELASSEPELSESEPSEPEPSEPELIESQLFESELVAPGSIESEPELTQPDTIESEPIKSKLTESQPFESGLAESELVELGLIESALNSTQLNSIAPELIEPELTESQLLVPEIELTQPDSIAPEPMESEYKSDTIVAQSDLFNLAPIEDLQDLSLVDYDAVTDASSDYEERLNLEPESDSISRPFDIDRSTDQFINQSTQLETNDLETRIDNVLLESKHNLIDDRSASEPTSEETALQDATREKYTGSADHASFANQEIACEDTLEAQNQYRSDVLPPEVEIQSSSTSQPRAAVPSPTLPQSSTTETRTTVEKSSARRSSHLVSLSAIGAFVTVSGVYALTRPCVVGSCPQLQQAQQLTQSAIQTVQSTESALEVVGAYKKLNEASYILGTIPVWSPYYRESQALLNSYDEQAVTLKDVVAALEQANTVAKQSQNPPHPLPEWRKIQWQWREVIKQLEQVSPESSLYSFAQRKLQDYRANLADINQRVGVEQQAQDRIAAARKAGQLAEARANAATTVEHWQETAATWETAIEQLKQIPQGTATYDEAQQLLAIYQPNLSTATTRQAQEQTAAIAYSEAVNAAKQARSLEQQNQWSQAAVQWQEAVNYSQQIPQNSGYYRQIQPLISSYTETLAQAKVNSQRSIAIQTVKPNLDRACGELKICTYTLSPETVRVQFTTAYDRTVEQVINSSNKQGTVSFPPDTVSQVNVLLRDLAAVSETTQVPLELYDSNGIKLGIYTPSVSGYVPQ